MTFPTLSTAVVTETGVGKQHVLVLPTYGVGDLLFFALGNGSSDVPTGLTGWTTLSSRTGAGWHALIAKVADGTEGEDLPLTTAENGQFGAVGVSVSGWFGGLNGVEAAKTEHAGGAAPSYACPTLTPSWGADDTYWFAIHIADSTQTLTGSPSGYTQIGSNGLAANGSATVHVYGLTLNIASETPGTFEMANSRETTSFTVGIRPAEIDISRRLMLLGVG